MFGDAGYGHVRKRYASIFTSVEYVELADELVVFRLAGISEAEQFHFSIFSFPEKEIGISGFRYENGSSFSTYVELFVIGHLTGGAGIAHIFGGGGTLDVIRFRSVFRFFGIFSRNVFESVVLMGYVLFVNGNCVKIWIHHLVSLEQGIGGCAVDRVCEIALADSCEHLSDASFGQIGFVVEIGRMSVPAVIGTGVSVVGSFWGVSFVKISCHMRILLTVKSPALTERDGNYLPRIWLMRRLPCESTMTEFG